MTVPIGVCSAAHVHAGAYASILSDLDGAELVGVTDEDDERGAAFADEHGIAFLPTDELLARVDGALVCSTNARHRSWVKRAADAGVDVLCEKPLAPTHEAALDVQTLAERAGIRLGVAMPLRFSEPARRARERFLNGEIGDLRAISGTNRGRMPGDWFVDPAEAGGGAAMDHTVHLVDLVHWLTGERVAEVYAELGTRMHDLPVEDVNVLSMELESGVGFLLDGSWSRPDEWHTWGDATVELTGSDGVLAADCFDQSFRLTRATGDDRGIRSVYWGEDPNARLLANFVDAVREDRTPETSAGEGVDAVAVVEAVYESDRRGEPVTVEY